MTDQLRSDIEFMYRRAVDAVRADVAVRSHLGVESGGRVRIAGETVDVSDAGVFAIAIGKAAVAMIEAVAEALGDRFTRGIAVTKSEASSDDPRISVFLGSHPVPDERSIAAGAEVLAFVENVPDGAVVLMLVSGGGSSLMEVLRDGVDLSRLREVTSGLLRAGATIHELNAVRQRLSRVKAGGLLQALAHARVFNLIVSDVLHDDLHTIASGPTIPSVDSDADEVMQRYQIPGQLPRLASRIEQRTPPTTIIANLPRAVEEAATAAAELGYDVIVQHDPLTGEARDIGRMMASRLIESAGVGNRTCLLAGGETTVTVVGDGIGGRNTEAALSAAIRLSGADRVAIGFLATDGDDGVTGAAGAIVDSSTVGIDDMLLANTALEANDSFPFLERRRTVLVVDPTGTNVNDLVIGLIG